MGYLVHVLGNPAVNPSRLFHEGVLFHNHVKSSMVLLQVNQQMMLQPIMDRLESLFYHDLHQDCCPSLSNRFPGNVHLLAMMVCGPDSFHCPDLVGPSLCPEPLYLLEILLDLDLDLCSRALYRELYHDYRHAILLCHDLCLVL
jgi:hypothetical protein